MKTTLLGTTIAGALLSPLLALASAPAASADQHECFATRDVTFCGTIAVGSSYAHGKVSITDRAGGRNMKVAVSNVRLIKVNRRTGATVSTSVVKDADGWHATSDMARTGGLSRKACKVYVLIADLRWSSSLGTGGVRSERLADFATRC